MTDITALLRRRDDALCREAADEIGRLQKDRRRLYYIAENASRAFIGIDTSRCTIDWYPRSAREREEHPVETLRRRIDERLEGEPK